MPFTDIFMTPALMFSGGRKRGAAPGADGWRPVVPSEPEAGRKHPRPLPSAPARSVPFRGEPCPPGAPFLRSLRAWFLPERLLRKLGMFLKCSDSALRVEPPCGSPAQE